MPTKVEQYEARYPGTGLSGPQKEDRMDRLAFQEERRSARRTTRNRGIVVPALPWRRKEQT